MTRDFGRVGKQRLFSSVIVAVLRVVKRLNEEAWRMILICGIMICAMMTSSNGREKIIKIHRHRVMNV